MSVRSPAVSVSRAAVSVSVRRGSFRCVRQAAGRSGRSGFRQRQRSRHRQRSYPWRGCACSIGPARGSLRSCSCDPAPVWRAQRVVCRVGLVEHVRHNPQGRRVAGRLDCETLLRSAFGTPTSCAGCVVCAAGWRGECGGREAQSGRRYRYRLPCPALRQCASVAQRPARSGSDAARRAAGARLATPARDAVEATRGVSHCDDLHTDSVPSCAPLCQLCPACSKLAEAAACLAPGAPARLSGGRVAPVSFRVPCAVSLVRHHGARRGD